MTITANDPNAQPAAAEYITLAKTEERSLRQAAEILVIRRGGFADADETRLINARLPRLEADRAAIEADLNAFLFENARVNPPSAADLAKAIALANTLDGMNAASNTASQVLGAATELAGIWNGTHV